jgi:hypothetical protein
LKTKERKRLRKMPLLVEKPTAELSMYQQRENLRADYKWITTQEEILRRKYLNKYVAVKDKKVLLADDNAYKLVDNLKAGGISVGNTAIKFLSDHPTCFLL